MHAHAAQNAACKTCKAKLRHLIPTLVLTRSGSTASALLMRSQLGTQARRQVDRRSLGAKASFVQLGGMFCDAESHTIHACYRDHKIAYIEREYH